MVAVWRKVQILLTPITKDGLKKPKKVGSVGRYSNFMQDSDTIDILFELGRYINEF